MAFLPVSFGRLATASTRHEYTAVISYDWLTSSSRGQYMVALSYGRLIHLLAWNRYTMGNFYFWSAVGAGRVGSGRRKQKITHIMMTSSNGNIFRVTGHMCAGNSPVPGEFPAQRPVTRSFHVFFDLRLNKPLSKQSWGWWFETLSRPLWRHCNVIGSRLWAGPASKSILIIHVAKLHWQYNM